MTQTDLGQFESTGYEHECPTCSYETDSRTGLGVHHRKTHGDYLLEALIQQEYGVPAGWLVRTLHHRLDRGVRSISDDLPGSRKAVKKIMEVYDIKQRSNAELTQARWDARTKEECREQVAAAHKTLRENYANGEGALQEWYRENPDRAKEHAREVAKLGAPAREENGMEGVTGQDHPNWTGGKSIYDALKKQLPGPSWDSIRKTERAGECYRCGVTDGRLSIHHIIPVMAGGTNGAYNRMTLCDECHGRAEAYTWSEFAESVYDYS